MTELRTGLREPAGPRPAQGGTPPTERDGRARRFAGYGLLALLAYVPLLLTQPGKVAADTKTYLYLDPGRLLSQAPSMWDPNIGLGTVTHQTIGYLFPMGPFYWVLEQLLGLPQWVSQRLWLGTLLFAAATGMLFLLRTLQVRGPGVVVGALAFMLTPYVLDYSARISVILGPWAALPWMVGIVILALRRGGWLYPALFAVVVQLVGGVNATALLFALIAPALWIPYAVWVTHEVTLRRALEVVGKIALLTFVTSLWWIAGLWAQGSYGLDILKFTETVQAVSKTSFPGEIMRGLGYWFFYGQDKIGPWTESAPDYTQHIWLILVSYGIPTLALLAAATVKWRYRTYFVLVMLIGVAIAVGASPYDNPSPFGGLFKAFANNSTAGLALRSTGRAVPLVVLGVAVFLAVGVNAVARTLTERGLPNRGLFVAGAVVVLLIVNFPALWDGAFYGKQLERPENIPNYWTNAIKYLDGQSHDTRIMELPGADFASYRWGNTVDPITPGLTDRPYVARELIPWGSPPSADLLNAFDRQLQESVLDPNAVGPIAGLMSVGDVTLRNDLQTDRYNLIRPSLLWQLFQPPPEGLGTPRTFGTTIPGTPHFPQLDERVLGSATPLPSPPPVAVFPVQDPPPIIRTAPSGAPLVVDGDGEGLVDVASTGLVTNDRAILYSASYADDPAALRRRVGNDGTLVVTDSNRKRARRWSTVRDNYGYTEQAGETPLVQDPSDARLEVFPGAPDSAFTVTQQRGVKSVQATHYGNPVSYTAEDRAERALDGDPQTAWRVDAFANDVGEKLRIRLDHPITTDHVNLLQPINGPRNRWITEATLTFDGKHPVKIALDGRSRDVSGAGQDVSFPKRTFSTLEIRIDADNIGARFTYGGVSAVGLAEVRMRADKAGSRDVGIDEVIRMPTDLLSATGASSLQHPLVLSMTRDRQYPVPPRTDPELELTRAFSLPTARAFAFSGQLRLDPVAPDDVLDRLVGIPDAQHGGITATSSEHLDGDARARASSAFDGNPATVWSTRFAEPENQWLQVTTPSPISFDHLDLQIVNDGRHSVPTKLLLTSDTGARRDITLPAIGDQATPNATVAVPVRFGAVSGTTFRLTIESVRPVRTLEYFSNFPMVMPVAIAETGMPGVHRGPEPAQLPAECRTDLLSVDGTPVGVRAVGTTAAAETYAPLDLQPCTPADTVALRAGDHVLRTQEGKRTGIDFDRVLLSSAAGGQAAPLTTITTTPGSNATATGGPGASAPARATAAPAMETLSQGRTSAKLRVAHATQPFWLVLGQSRNDGWTAKANGKDLGTPELVDGYANGWLVQPAANGGPITLSLDWTPQRTVWAAIWASLAGAAACLAIIAVGLVRRRRRRGEPDAPVGDASAGPVDAQLASPTIVQGARVSPAAIAGTTVVAAALGGGLVRPWCAVLTGGVTLFVLLKPRWRAVLSLFPFLALGLCGLYAAASQFHYAVPAIFEWPTQLWRVRTLGWLAVVFFACDAIVEIVSRHAAREQQPPAVPDTAPPATT